MVTMPDIAEEVFAADDCRGGQISAARPVRVCHVSMHLKTGGLERLLVEFARRHDRQLVQPLFVALQDTGPPAEEISACGCPVRRINLAENGKPGSLKSLRQLLRSEQVDLVHTHNTYAHFYGALAARAAGVRAVVNTQHGRGCGPGWKARLQFRIANRWTARIVGVSADAAALCRDEDRRSRRKVITIRNGIDPGRFKYRGSQAQPTLIAVGRLSPEKDFATLLRAAAIAAPAVPELSLQIVGDGAERAALERLARELHLGDRVAFLGERSDIPDRLAEAGCYVASSRTEGISLTLLEAMAVGLPAITTRVGGNSEVVEDHVTGRLVPAGDPEQLASAIVAMCRDRERWPEMGRRGRERVERHFGIDRMVHDYEQLYTEVLYECAGGERP